ncbi:TlpA family protein disulfide reductase [Ekhidna sp.]
MKKLTTYLFIIIVSLYAHAQLEITIYGDVNDSTVIKRKQAMEAKGFSVQVKPERNLGAYETDDNNEFIAKWTGKKLPSFTLTDLEGNMVSNKDLQGKIVHINFWSVTCRPCIEEFPELDQLKEKYGQEVMFLAIAPENTKKVNKVFARHSLEYQRIADGSSIFEELGIDGYPKNFFINKEGIIEKIIDGTHYKIGDDNGKAIMVPDNFKYYDKVLASMTSSER